jgi:gamma-glutamyltranspeptidase/glutathione hydrolase
MKGIDDRYAHLLHRDDVRSEARHWTASSGSGVIATAHFLATAIGARVLARGGNAVDAAVAASLALSVCESAGSGIGGMAMMIVHRAEERRTFAVEGPCRAPRLATPEAVRAAHRYRGHRAVAVPTMLAVLDHALARYGTLPFAELVEPAIELAERGFPFSPLQREVALQYEDGLRPRSGARFFLDDDGNVRQVGFRFKQPVLARTLRRLQAAGVRDFYQGEVAAGIDRDMRANDGFVRADDLAEAVAVRESEPVRAPCGDGEACTLGPPGGGLALAQLLLMSAALRERIDLDSDRGVVWLAELICQARSDRKRTSKRIAAHGLRGADDLLDPELAREAIERLAAPPDEPGETTHLSVMDRFGNAVGLTQSLERSYGSCEAAAAFGFLYNGYLRAFKVRATNHPHFLRPGAVARSNAAPTIVMAGERPQIVLGSTGSERMVSGIFEVLLRLRTAEPFAAVHAPRLHSTPQRSVLWEAARFPAGSSEALERRGFVLEDLGPYSFKVGGLQLAMRQGDRLVAVADPRRDGAASGPAP